MLKTDEHYMLLAIEEAKKGQGRTSPNPCVGAVIVQNDTIIGRGYHKKAGTPHAEINAINDVEREIAGATIYVTLEPCSHTGKTPPCCKAIVEAGFSRVVIGMTDPNPLVNGNGVKFLEDHGLDVESGVLSKECEAINYPFIKYITTGLPWMVMKAGVSLDGRLNYQTGESGWITGPESAHAVHKLRDTYDAIMVGANTAKIDNPSLTCRLPWDTDSPSKDPIRLVLDTSLDLPLNSKLFVNDSRAPTWVICSEEVVLEKVKLIEEKGIVVLRVPTREDGTLKLKDLLRKLGQEEVCSVLVEGGGALHGSFLQEKLYDYAYLFYAPLFAGDQGVPICSGIGVTGRDEAIKVETQDVIRCGEDFLVSGQIKYP